MRPFHRGVWSTKQRARIDASSSDVLHIIGGELSHDTLRRALASAPPMRILDVPAGEGMLARFLKDKGWEVHCADIDPGNFRLTDVPFSKVDLNSALPYADSSFDAISCVNGLHRLLFPEVAIREFARILRPSGTLYINLNNYSSIRRRLRFLVIGSIDREIETQECRQTISDPRAHVRLPLMYPRLEAMLHRADFEIVRIRRAAYRWQDKILVPLAFLVWLAGRLLLTSGQRARLRADGGNEWRVLAGGQYFYLEAKRRRPGVS